MSSTPPTFLGLFSCPRLGLPECLPPFLDLCICRIRESHACGPPGVWKFFRGGGKRPRHLCGHVTVPVTWLWHVLFPRDLGNQSLSCMLPPCGRGEWRRARGRVCCVRPLRISTCTDVHVHMSPFPRYCWGCVLTDSSTGVCILESSDMTHRYVTFPNTMPASRQMSPHARLPRDTRSSCSSATVGSGQGSEEQGSSRPPTLQAD